MSSENPSGAENQQETESPRTELDPHWVVGFVDGEGCFSVSIHQNPYVRRTRGWHIQPVFQVYQHESYRAVLEELVSFFGCGRVRPKGPKSSVLSYIVSSQRDVEGRILPFFERYPLMIKCADFERFAAIVRAIRKKQHLTHSGFERVVRLAFAMNANGKQRGHTLEQVLSGSSETARQAPLFVAAKIQSEPHGDMGSQAEMTWPLTPATSRHEE